MMGYYIHRQVSASRCILLIICTSSFGSTAQATSDEPDFVRYRNILEGSLLLGDLQYQKFGTVVHNKVHPEQLVAQLFLCLANASALIKTSIIETMVTVYECTGQIFKCRSLSQRQYSYVIDGPDRLGCVHVIQPYILPRHDEGRFFFPNIFRVKLLVERALVMNITFVDFDMVYDGVFCNLGGIYISSLMTFEWPIEVPICASHGFPGHGKSLISHTQSVVISGFGFVSHMDNVKIIYYGVQKPLVNTSGLFSIKDMDIVSGGILSPLTIHSFVEHVWRLRNVPGNVFVLRFHLQLLLQLTLFDGPGIRSPKIEKSIYLNHSEELMVITSLPIVTIVVKKGNLPRPFKEIKWSSIGQHNNTNLNCYPSPAFKVWPVATSHYDEIEIEGRQQNGIGTSCFWLFNTAPKQTVEIHITNMHYQGPTDANCSYGGITFNSLEQQRDLVFLSRDVSFCGKLIEEKDDKLNFTIRSSKDIIGIEFALYPPYSRGYFKARVRKRYCLVYTNPCVYNVLTDHQTVRLFLWINDTDSNIKCFIIQQLQHVEEYIATPGHYQHTCSVIVDAISFHLTIANLQQVYMPDLRNFKISGWPRLMDYKLPYSLVIPHQVNLSKAYLLENNYRKTGALKFEQSFFLSIKFHPDLGLQLPVVIILSDIHAKIFVRMLGSVQNNVLTGVLNSWGAWSDLFYVPAQNIYKQRTSFSIEYTDELLKKQHEVWLCWMLTIFYQKGCALKCSDDKIIVKLQEIGSRNTDSHKVLATFSEISPKPILFYPLYPQKDFIHKYQAVVTVTRLVKNNIERNLSCPLYFQLLVTPIKRISGVCSSLFPVINRKKYFSFQVNGTCFFMLLPKFSYNLSWVDAEVECNSRGATLASLAIDTKDFIYAIWQSLYSMDDLESFPKLGAYIGLRLTEKGLRWNNGKLVVERAKWTNYTLALRSNLSHKGTLCGALTCLQPWPDGLPQLMPCSLVQRSSYICQFSSPNPKNKTQLDLTQPNTECSRTSIVTGTACVFLLKPISLKPNMSCTLYGYSTFIFKGRSSAVLKYVYQLMKSACLFVNMEASNLERNPILTNLRLAFPNMLNLHWLKVLINTVRNFELIQKCENNQSGFFCEKTAKIINRPQKPHLFECWGENYILKDFLCDGMADCPGGEDESKCVTICKSNISMHQLDLCSCSHTKFRCKASGCVNAEKVCDGYGDCSDNSDEDTCKFRDCRQNEFRCGDWHCIDLKSKCNSVVDCVDESDEIDCEYHNRCQHYACSSGECIQRYQINNFIPDCISLEDEEEYLFLSKSGFYLSNFTFSFGTLPCFLGHSSVFPMGKACVYDTMPDWSIAFCGNGEHLRHCEDMDCPRGTYKCPDSYCIPVRKICDGIFDCLNGVDESSCPLNKCPEGFFKCKGEVRCLLPDEVCDGKIQCEMHADDERTCGRPDCPPKCNCNLTSVCCSTVHGHQLWSAIMIGNHSVAWKRNLTVLSLTNAKLFSLRNLSSMCPFLRYICLSNNIINKVYTNEIERFVFMYFIDLSYNNINHLPYGLFSNLLNLRHLNISHNFLQILSGNVFSDLHKLHSLDVSYNVIKEIQFTYGNSRLVVLWMNIIGNNISTHIGFVQSKRVLLIELLTNQVSLCCIAKWCGQLTAESKLFCKSLLHSKAHRFLYAITGIVICLSCILIILLHHLVRRKRMDHMQNHYSLWNTSLLLRLNTLMAELLFGIYFLSTFLVDQIIKEDFPYKKKQWLESTFCLLTKVASLSAPVQSTLLLSISNVHFYIKVFTANPVSVDPRINSTVPVSWTVSVSISLVLHYTTLTVINSGTSGLCSIFKSAITFKDMFKREFIPTLFYFLFLLSSYFLNACIFYKIFRKIKVLKLSSKRKNFTQQEKNLFARLIILLVGRTAIFAAVMSVSSVNIGMYTFQNLQCMILACQTLLRLFDIVVSEILKH